MKNRLKKYLAGGAITAGAGALSGLLSKGGEEGSFDPSSLVMGGTGAAISFIQAMKEKEEMKKQAKLANEANLVGMNNQAYMNQNLNSNPLGMKYGGKLKKFMMGGNAMNANITEGGMVDPTSSQGGMAVGRSHEMGGIKADTDMDGQEDVEIEGNEFVRENPSTGDTEISSAALIMPSGNTIASATERIEKMRARYEKKPSNMISKYGHNLDKVFNKAQDAISQYQEMIKPQPPAPLPEGNVTDPSMREGNPMEGSPAQEAATDVVESGVARYGGKLQKMRLGGKPLPPKIMETIKNLNREDVEKIFPKFYNYDKKRNLDNIDIADLTRKPATKPGLPEDLEMVDTPALKKRNGLRNILGRIKKGAKETIGEDNNVLRDLTLNADTLGYFFNRNTGDVPELNTSQLMNYEKAKEFTQPIEQNYNTARKALNRRRGSNASDLATLTSSKLQDLTKEKFRADSQTQQNRLNAAMQNQQIGTQNNAIRYQNASEQFLFDKDKKTQRQDFLKHLSLRGQTNLRDENAANLSREQLDMIKKYFNDGTVDVTDIDNPNVQTNKYGGTITKNKRKKLNKLLRNYKMGGVLPNMKSPIGNKLKYNYPFVTNSI